MTPYYEKDGITIYHGDCREVLSRLRADVVIADPPYNVGKSYGTHNDRMSADDYDQWITDVLGLCEEAAPELVYFPGKFNLWSVQKVLPNTMRPYRLLGWHKREFAGDKWHGGPPMSWEPIVWASSRERPAFNKIFGEFGRDFLVVNATHGDPLADIHPCPKPMRVMAWLVSLFVPEGGTCIDPTVGTGTTLRAAKDLGRKAIGIEIEERYCEIAAKRMEQGVLQFEAS